MQNKDVDNYFYAPTIEDILLYTNQSSDPALVKPKFYRYLSEYQETGLCCKRPKLLTKERSKYYDKIQEQKIYEFSRDARAKQKEKDAIMKKVAELRKGV